MFVAGAVVCDAVSRSAIHKRLLAINLRSTAEQRNGAKWKDIFPTMYIGWVIAPVIVFATRIWPLQRTRHALRTGWSEKEKFYTELAQNSANKTNFFRQIVLRTRST